MIDRTKDQLTQGIPTEGLHPDWVERSGFDRRVKAVAVEREQRSGLERRSALREKLQQIAHRLIGGKKKGQSAANQAQTAAANALAATPQPQMTAIIARPPKPTPVPPTRPGAEELRPIGATKPGQVPSSGVARDYYGGWAARTNAPFSLDPNPKNDQAAGPDQPVGQAPSVTVFDVNGKPVNGVVVTFAVAEGKGRVRLANSNDWVAVVRVKTGVNGVAPVGGWRLGSQSGTINTLVAGINGLSHKFRAKTN